MQKAWEGWEEGGCLGTSGDGNSTRLVRDRLHPTPLPAPTRATVCSSSPCSPLHPSPKLDAGVIPRGSLQVVMSGRDAACIHLLSPLSYVHHEPHGARAVFSCPVGTAPSAVGSEGVKDVVGELGRGAEGCK